MSALELDDLLAELRHRSWLLHYFGTQYNELMAIAAVRRWQVCADVLIMRGEHDAVAFRVPAFPETDWFAPDWVNWLYTASALWTLRAVLTLDPPGHPRAPCGVLQAPQSCRIPQEHRRPVTIRP